TTRVIILTSMDGQAVLARAIEAGAVAFVRKAEPLEQVIAAIRSVAAGETFFSASVLSKLIETIRRPKGVVGADLTPREMEVLQLLGNGLSTAAIAEELIVSHHTARN